MMKSTLYGLHCRRLVEDSSTLKAQHRSQSGHYPAAKTLLGRRHALLCAYCAITLLRVPVKKSSGQQTSAASVSRASSMSYLPPCGKFSLYKASAA